MESDSGWWLITHPDHARLAGDFAEAWGNADFRRPEPRARVLHGIASHDDGWTARDAHPTITRRGKPSAFSTELVGKYSAFEEIDIADYLAVRERAVRLIAEQDPYAGLLVLMHTYNLLSEHADRSTMRRRGSRCLTSSSIASASIAAPYWRRLRTTKPCARKRNRSRQFSSISACCRPATIFRF